MKKIILPVILMTVCGNSFAQIKPETIIEGGKALIELIRIISPPKKGALTGVKQNQDSIMAREFSELCFKNELQLDIKVTLHKKVNEKYTDAAFEMKVLSSAEECVYEMRPGIYRYRIKIKEEMYREGELRLQPGERMVREITIQ